MDKEQEKKRELKLPEGKEWEEVKKLLLPSHETSEIIPAIRGARADHQLPSCAKCSTYLLYAQICHLKKLGYRKLPKEKPPLLSEDAMHRLEGEWFKGLPSIKPLLSEVIAQTQREADIKWYENLELLNM